MSRLTKRDSWEGHLKEVRNPSALFSNPAGPALLRLLTLGGKLPFRSAIASLTIREKVVFQHILGREQVRLVAPHQPGFDRRDVTVAHSAHGRLTLHETGRDDPAIDEDIIAGIRLPGWLLEMIEEEAAAEQALDDHERSCVDALLEHWRDEGVLPTKLREVTDWVERVETVFVYIGRHVFSRSDSGSSTLVKGGVLPALRDRALEEWSPEERLFVGAAQLLFRTGRAVRFEEFNGRQLTATRLRRLLLRRCSSYRSALGLPPDADLSTMTTADLAATAGDLVAAVDEGRSIRYRRINGLSYAKDEFLMPWEAVDRSVAHMPSVLDVLATRHRGAGPPPGADPHALVRELTGRAVEIAELDGDTAPLDEILHAIVLGAVLATGGDYAMSSGIRDLALISETGNSPDRILDLRKPDFFCCVLPSPKLAHTFPEEDLGGILWQVAQRMMYNRWHFVPGNFDRARIPERRHYFFPPQVPDIGEWCDQRHGGHSTSRVRFTLRAPGPAMWIPAFASDGHPHRGCFDIRVVRMEGPPFTLADLRTACRYSQLVDAYWRELSERSRAGGFSPPRTSSYSADWYREGHWRKPLELFAPDADNAMAASR